MKLMDWLKLILPKPKIMQKRYMVMIGLALYYAAKAYVSYTDSPEDDYYPDQIKGVILDMFADEESKPDLSVDYADDGLRYGEGE